MANLLPSSNNKNKPVVFAKDSFVPKSGLITKNTINQNQFFEEEIEKVKVKVLDIDKTIEERYKVFRKKIKLKNFIKKKEEEKEKESKVEKKEKKSFDLKAPKALDMPKTGFLDGIKNYLGNILMGLFFTRINEFMPAIKTVFNIIKPVVSFLADIGAKLLDGLITFIDWGYKAYDQTRSWIGEKLGDNAIKKFDEFTKAFDTFITGAITLGIIYSQGKDFGKPGGGKPVGIRGKIDGRVKRGGVKSDAARRYADRYGKDAAVRKFGREGVKSLGGKYARSGAQNLIRKGVVSTLGKGGTKAVLKFTRPFLKRLPLIGGLIDFGLSVAMGEPLGRAAFKSIGAGLLGAIGTGFGGPVGAILGGMAGDWAGGKLYDILFTGKKEPQKKQEKIQRKNQGGTVTRGGKRVGGAITRTIRRAPSKKIVRTIKVKPQITRPGQNVGGEKRIQRLYPDTTDKTQANPYKVLKKASESFKKISTFNNVIGSLMGAAVDTVLGQKVEPAVLQNIGKNFGAFVENAVNQQTNASISDIARSIQGLADGGVVEDKGKTVTKYSKNVASIITSSLTNTVNSQINKILNDIQNQLKLAPITIGGGGGGGGGDGGGAAGGGVLPGDAPPEIKALLEAIASGEGGWNSVNSGLTIKGLSDMTIAEARETGMRIRREGKGSGALGRWQQMPIINGVNTLKQRAESAGLNYEKDKFSPENQTKISRAYLSSVYGGEAKLLKDLKTDPMIAVRKLRGVWPSLPGGSQANQDELEFKRTYSKSVEKYYKASGRGPEAKVTGGVLPSKVTFMSSQGWRWGRMHKGIDITAGRGSPISSAQDAVVVWAGDKKDQYGNSVVLKYANGSETRFAHFDSINVKTGQKIKAGQLLGKEGVTGRVTGPHLHFEFYPNGGAMTYEGYGDANSVKDSYFRYGGNVQPIIPDKPLDKPTTPKLPEVGAGLNKGVYYDPSKNKFFKKGGGFLGLDQEININEGTNIQYRSLPNFLGRGTKKNERKRGPDGQMYYWDGNNWQKFTDPEQLMSSQKPSGLNSFISNLPIKNNASSINSLVASNSVSSPAMSSFAGSAAPIQEYTEYAPMGGSQTKVLIQPIVTPQMA